MREQTGPEAQRSVEDILEAIYEVQMGTFVQVSRIYDLLAIQAGKVVEERSDTLEEMVLDLHEQGVIFGPVPELRGFAKRETDEDED